MHVVDAARRNAAGTRSQAHLIRAALVVAVLGVLPFVLDAHAVWQVLGPLVAVAFLCRGLQLVWRAALGTDPRHLRG